MQILFSSSATNPACSPASPFCTVKLHYQDNSYYPTALTLLALGSPRDFVTARLGLTCTSALGVLGVLLHPSPGLSRQLKSFGPAEENVSIRSETSHQHPQLLGPPIKPRMGDRSYFPLICPPLLPCRRLFPTIPFTDILVAVHSALPSSPSISTFSSVFPPHLSGLFPCPCPSALVWPFLACARPLLPLTGGTH